MNTITTEELLSRYEVQVNKFRNRPKFENEIIVETWARICNILLERSFADGVPFKERKYMRIASRTIRGALLTNRKYIPKTKDKDLLAGAGAKGYSVAMEILESMVLDADLMMRLARGGHALKSRLNACRIRLVHAIEVIGSNLQDFKME